MVWSESARRVRQREWCPTVSSAHTRHKVSPVATDSRRVGHLQGRLGGGDAGGGPLITATSSSEVILGGGGYCDMFNLKDNDIIWLSFLHCRY